MKKLCCLLLAAILGLSACVCGCLAAGDDPVSPDRQKRARALQEAAESDAADETDAVTQLLEQAVRDDELCVTFTPADGTDVDELLSAAFLTVRYNRPELAWKLTGQWSYVSGGGTVTVYPEYAAEADVLRQMQAEIESRTEAVLLLLLEQEDEWHELLALHDWLCENVTYGENDFGQTIYGALVLGQCVCAGYSSAFAYFLDQLGIENFTVIGTAVNDQGQYDTHSWNRVTEDGVNYYVDVTWDDTDQFTDDGSELVLHDYFMVSAGTLAYHFPDNAEDMPADENGEGPWNYHVHEGYYLAEYDYDALCAALSAQAARGDAVLTVRLADAQGYLLSEASLDGGNDLLPVLASLGYRGCTWFAVNPESDEVFAWNIVPE